MEFPVDVLGSASHEELEQEAEAYLAELRYVSPDKAQSFTLNNHRKIRITLSNVGFAPVYGGDLRHKVLALFAPEDQLTAVALFLAGEWWTVEDILRTSDPSRAGLVKVRTLGERIALYALNRVVYRVGEMAKPEVPFLCHSQHDFAKILWKDGQAVGFYSVKPKDSLSNNFVTQRYQLPVMDTIFIRKSHRGNGHGLQMLEDFVDSFKDDELGLKYPLSVAMYKVCSQYLYHYPADEDLLWVVEGVGGPYQRESVAGKLKKLVPKVTVELFAANGDHQPENDMEQNEASSVYCTEVTEDVVVVNKPLKLLEDMEDTPVSTRTRSSERKRPREMTEEFLDESLPSKVNRLEEGEAEATTTTSVVEEMEADEKEEESSASVDAETDTEPAVAPEAPVEDEAAAEPSAKGVEEVNGVMADEQADEEEEEEETKTKAEEEEGEVAVEVPQEQESVLENGTGVEDIPMEEEGEEEMKEREESTGEKDPVEAALVEAEDKTAEEEMEKQTAEEETEKQTAEEEKVKQTAEEEKEKQSAEEETEKQTAEKEKQTAEEETEKQTAEEKVKQTDEEETEKQTAEEETEKQTAEEEAEEQSAEEETEEGTGTASGEEPCSAPEEASSPSDSAPEELSAAGEMTEEAGEEPPGLPEAVGPEEASAVPVEEEEEEEERAMEESKENEKEAKEGADVIDNNQETVLLVGVADLKYQPTEDAATLQTEEEEEKKELAEDVAVSSEEEEEEKEVAEKSSDEAEEAPAGRRKGRRGRTTKRRSKRLSKAPAKEEDVEMTEEEEEKLVTTEEEGEAVEKLVTTEEEGEAVEKTSAEEEEEEEEEQEEQEEEEEEEPPVVDQRAPRRKSRPIHSPAKPRGKRRSKI